MVGGGLSAGAGAHVDEPYPVSAAGEGRGGDTKDKVTILQKALDVIWVRRGSARKLRSTSHKHTRE